ncbi:MAG: hypothetical protein WB778_05445 [Thermoplasmata archaeon]
MTAAPATARSSPPLWSRRLPSALLLALAAVALGSQSSFGLLFGIAFTTGTVAIGVYLRFRGGGYRLFGLEFPLVGLVFASGWSRISVLTELLAGVTGLLYLLWLADDAPPAPESTRNVIQALALPSLALGVALVSSFLVPVTSLLIGATAGILVALLLGVAWLFEHPEAIHSKALDS